MEYLQKYRTGQYKRLVRALEGVALSYKQDEDSFFSAIVYILNGGKNNG